MRRSVFLIPAILVAMAAASANADAEPAYCNTLRGELATTGGSGGGSTASLDLVRAQARQAGCFGRFLFFGRPPSPACPSIMARLNSLQRSAPSGGGLFSIFGGGNRRYELQQAMARWGCAPSSGGSVRTLCVRKCDGYYFPISTSASKKRLKIDAAVCQAMYPGGEAELYTQRGETDDQIMSLAGKPYAGEPFAFRFRTSYDPACAASLNREPRLAASIPSKKPQVSVTLAAAQPSPMARESPAARWLTPPYVARRVGPESYAVTALDAAATENAPPGKTRFPLTLKPATPGPLAEE